MLPCLELFKMNSSIREPVSTSAVARMVSDPPSSMLRAAPKKRFGFVQRIGIDAAGENLAGVRLHGVVSACQTRDGIEQNHTSFLCSTCGGLFFR